MRAEGIFIAVEVSDEAATDTALAAKLTEACPVYDGEAILTRA